MLTLRNLETLFIIGFDYLIYLDIKPYKSKIELRKYITSRKTAPQPKGLRRSSFFINFYSLTLIPSEI